jgi:hypothetical protein
MKIVNSTALLAEPSESPAYELKRDIATQTALTFPPILPKEVEDLLKKYRFIENNESQRCEELEDDTLDITSQSNKSMMDISVLRRKLFINRPESPSDDMPYETFGAQLHLEFSPPPRTPELSRSCNKAPVDSAALKSNDSFGSDMFGELSPIQACSSPSFSNDVSMISDRGQEQTPSRKGCRRLKKKGKNLSESFCLLQNEFNGCSNDDGVLSDKENQIDSIVTREIVSDPPKRFARFDSGFSNDEDSKLSADFMQF